MMVVMNFHRAFRLDNHEIERDEKNQNGPDEFGGNGAETKN